MTLRGARMWEFLDRFITVAIPRIRDFRGLPTRCFDGRGNYSLGIKEQMIFPEIDYDKVEKIHGMDITFVTTTERDDQALALLRELGMPFRGETPQRGCVRGTHGEDLVGSREPSGRRSSRCAASTAASAAAASRALLRKFGLCRICFRELALKGEIPGVRKASW